MGERPSQSDRGVTAALVAYNLILSALAVYMLVSIWPAGGPTAQADTLFGFAFSLGDEARILWIVIIVGAIGSLVHSMTSLVSYVGSKKFVRSWTVWYLVRPIIGSSLALVFYFVFRGGLFAPTTEASGVNLFGVAALSGLVGMFSKEAVDKLAEVFRTMFKSEEDTKRPNKLQG